MALLAASALLGCIAQVTWSPSESMAAAKVEKQIGSIEIKPPIATVMVNGSASFKATVRATDGSVIRGKKITWGCTLPNNVGEINATGKFTAKCTTQTGLHQHCVSATVEGSGIVGKASVVITPGKPASVVVSPNSATVECGKTQQFTATVFDPCGNIISNAKVNWSAGRIGTVNPRSGLTTVFTAGVTPCLSGTVTASSSGKKGTASVSVTIPSDAIVKLFVNGKPVPESGLEIEAGGTRTFRAKGYYYPSGRETELRGLTFTYGIVGDDIGTINPTSGIFKADIHADRTGSVTAQATCGGPLGTAKVTIVPGAPNRVEVIPPNNTLSSGQEFQYQASAYDAYDNLIANAQFKWSANPKAGAIAPDTSLFKAGTTEGTFAKGIKATTLVKNKSGYGDVTITQGAVGGDEYKQIRQVEASIQTRLLLQLYAGVPVEKALTSATNWAKSQSVVQSAGVSLEGHDGWLIFKGGQGMAISIPDETFTLPGYIGSNTSGEPLSHASDEMMATSPKTDFVLVGQNKAVCLNCFPLLPFADLCSRLESYGYENETWQHFMASVSDFYTITKYGFVHINSHGGRCGNIPVLFTGEIAIPPPTLEVSSDFVNMWNKRLLVHGLLILDFNNNIHSPLWYYAITPLFIQQLPKFESPAIVVLQACLMYPDFANAFLERGATTVLAPQGEIFVNDDPVKNEISATTALNLLFGSVCPKDPEQQPVVLADAFTGSIADNDESGFELVSSGKPANPIPVLEAAIASSSPQTDILMLNGTTGTENKGKVLIDSEECPYLGPFSKTPSDWSADEIQCDISGWYSGESAVQVKVNGILSNIKNFEIPPRSWRVSVADWQCDDLCCHGEEKRGEEVRSFAYTTARAFHHVGCGLMVSFSNHDAYTSATFADTPPHGDMDLEDRAFYEGHPSCGRLCLFCDPVLCRDDPLDLVITRFDPNDPDDWTTVSGIITARLWTGVYKYSPDHRWAYYSSIDIMNVPFSAVWFFLGEDPCYSGSRQTNRR